MQPTRDAETTARAPCGHQRLGNELGGAIGFDAGINAVNALVPEARGVLGLGRAALGLAAGSVAAEGTSEAGQAVGGGAFSAATGRKAPGYKPPDQDLGEMAASGVGSTAGAILLGGVGSALGGPAGSLAAGTLGGYAGGLLGAGAFDAGRSIARWFTGYDPHSAQRAMARFGAR